MKIKKISGTAVLQGNVIDSVFGDSTKNASSQNSINNVLTYSDKEQVVGIFVINNKKRKIYRKTIYRPVLINGTEETVEHGIENVDIMWSDPAHSIAIWPQPLNLANNLSFLNSVGNNITLTDFTPTTFKLASPLNRNNLSGYVTLLYLKTDDK